MNNPRKTLATNSNLQVRRVPLRNWKKPGETVIRMIPLRYRVKEMVK